MLLSYDVPGTIYASNTSMYTRVRVLVSTMYHIHFCFCVPFATLCSCGPAAAEPNTTFVLLLLLLFVPPSAAVVPSPAAAASMPPAPITCSFLLFRQYNICLEKFSDKKAFFFFHRRSLEQVDGEAINLYEKRPGGNFLIDISRRLLNELKRGWLCQAHYIPGQVTAPSVTLSTQGKSSPRRKIKENNKKNMCYSALTRGIYKTYKIPLRSGEL